MSNVLEGIRGALGLIFAGFILLVFAQAIADTALDTGVVDLSLVGIVAILGGAVVLVVVVAVLISKLLT